MVSEISPTSSNSSILHHHFDGSYNGQSNTLIPNSHFPHPVISNSIELANAPQLSDNNSTSPLMDFLGKTSNEASSHRPRKLSLSLGSDPLNPTLVTPSYNLASSRESCNSMIDSASDDYSFTRVESFVSMIGSSKYLKPAQSLLEETVSVGGKEIDIEKYVEKLSSGDRKGSYRFSNELFSDKHGTCVDLLNLITLLEEVERRYEEYLHKMEEIVTSFEVVAGLGSGKSYTALALQAMSKHFLKLRNAIVLQIRATKQRMDKDIPKIDSRLSELNLLELGIIHNPRQTWRPIRGLPENSVSILRSWLFEHFLHPYPNDSEKLMLASQTGLSKNQVSNWFINARVRLWKPMIEEMYKEEFGEDSE